MQKSGRDGWPAAPVLPALDLLAERLRQRIVWELAHEPRTPTALARVLGCSQPLVSKHLRILRAAGLVESRRDPRDRRARVYDIRREQLVALRAWLNDIQRNWQRRHTKPTSDHHDHISPSFTTRGTVRKRIPRALKEPWER
jgi:DNA-binding transcriptional ArsR family regulator